MIKAVLICASPTARCRKSLAWVKLARRRTAICGTGLKPPRRRREQGRGADRLADLARKRVHVVAKQRSGVGIGAEIEVAPGIAEFHLGGAQQGVTIAAERVLTGPDLLDDLQSGVVPIGVDRDQP